MMKRTICFFLLLLVLSSSQAVCGALSESVPIVREPFQSAPDNRIGCLQFGVYQPEWLAWDQLIEPIGFKRVRFSVCVGDWNCVDWSRSDYALTDALVDQLRMLADNGVKITYVLTFWDTDHHPDGVWGTAQNRFKSETDIARYLDFIRYIAQKCKGIVMNYEFFNEPSRTDSPIQYIEPADYVNLVRRAAPVLRSVDPSAKLIIGATSDLFDPAAEQWLFDVMKPEILPLVDGISWHGMGEASPQYPYYQAYLRRYASLVDQIKTYARERGFNGVFVSDELRWGTPGNHNADKMEFMYTETTSAKYFAREIVRHLGMDVVTGCAMDLSDPTRLNHQTVRNLCTVLGDAQAYPLPLQVQCDSKDLQFYTFRMQNGDLLLSLWRDEPAADKCAGVPATVLVPAIGCDGAEQIDVLAGTRQPVGCIEVSDGVTLADIPITDYPMLYRLTGIRTDGYDAMLKQPDALADLYQKAVLLNGNRDVLLGLYQTLPGEQKLRASIQSAMSLLEGTEGSPVGVTVQADSDEPMKTAVYSTLTGDCLVALVGDAPGQAKLTLDGVTGVNAMVWDGGAKWQKIKLRNTKQGAQCEASLSSGLAVITVTPKNPQSRVASFKDPAVEAAVRTALNKPDGLLSLEEIKAVTQLELSRQGVTTLEGLQALSNLEYLDAPGNSLRDLTPLQNLTQLKHLELWDNQIKELRPLAGLTNLENLWIGNNPIADLSPLSALGRISRLGVWQCRIKDLSVLADFPLLKELDVRWNPIRDDSILDELPDVHILRD